MGVGVMGVGVGGDRVTHRADSVHSHNLRNKREGHNGLALVTVCFDPSDLALAKISY